MNDPLLGFDEALRQLLERKMISASELARRMNLKSRNSVFRILTGKGSWQTHRAFLERLVEEDALLLTEAEEEWLRQTIEVDRLGPQRYRDGADMRSLMRVAGRRRMTKPIAVVSMEGGEERDFASLLASFLRGGFLRVTMCGCCYANLLDTIAAVLTTGPDECDARILHLHIPRWDEEISTIFALQGILYLRCYEPISADDGMFSEEKENILRSNFMLVSYRDEEGRMRYCQLVLVDSDKLMMLPVLNERALEFANSLLLDESACLRPLKKPILLRHTAEDYIDYTRNYGLMENKRAVYMIRKDIPINFIHPDLLVPGIVDGAARVGLIRKEEIGRLVEALYGIHLKRWKNFATKKKPTRLAFSRAAMEQFARTGVQSDHFFAMRPFTPGERVAVLKQLCEMAERNPNFRFAFFRNEQLVPEAEMALYEGGGLLFTKANTDYNLEKEHEEALVQRPGFCRKFKDFFVNELLTEETISEEETIASMDEFIRIAEKAIR